MALPSNKLITINDRGARAATTFGSLSAGGANMVFIKKLTASSSATLSFVDGASSVVLDDTYKEYLFTFNNIHPATDGVLFRFNVSIDGGSNYNVAKTSSFFRTQHDEGDTNTALSYLDGNHLAQGTGVQDLGTNIGNDNDQHMVGELTIFNPSSTTFVKHFMARVTFAHAANFTLDGYAAGYANTTSAVNAVQFSMSSGNIDAGTIKMYGVGPKQ